MPTPLENFFANPENMAHAPSRDTFAIGDDNRHSRNLCDYIEERYEVGHFPQTLARWLKATNKEWTEKRNGDWIRTVVANGAVTTCCICHVKTIEALRALSSAGQAITVANFNRVYKGNRKSTYKEVIVAIDAGFTTMTLFDLDDPLAVLKR